MKQYIAIIIWIFSFSCFAQGAQEYPKSVTAICKNPIGYAIHLTNDGRIEEAKDGFSNAAWVFSWNSRHPDDGNVRTSADQRVSDHAKTLIFMTEPRAINFLSIFSSGVWNYTIFLDRKIMIASKHMDSKIHNRMIGSIFHAKCDIHIKQ